MHLPYVTSPYIDNSANESAVILYFENSSNNFFLIHLTLYETACLVNPYILPISAYDNPFIKYKFTIFLWSSDNVVNDLFIFDIKSFLSILFSVDILSSLKVSSTVTLSLSFDFEYILHISQLPPLFCLFLF